MNLMRLISLVLVTGLASSTNAQVTLTRSSQKIVLENSMVRVELHQNRNFQPSVLIDKRNRQNSLVDAIGILAWDVPKSDWLISATCDWTAAVKTHSDSKVGWCETTLVRQRSGSKPSRMILRTTVRRNSPAVKFDFHVEFQPQHVHSVGLRIQASHYKSAKWKTSWGTRELRLVGRRNRFHSLLGFQNGLVLTRRKGNSRTGLLLFHNSAWNTVFPTLREKPKFVRYKHPTLSSPARCSLTLVPFIGDPSLASSNKKWGRPQGAKLLSLGTPPKPKAKRIEHKLTPGDKKRGCVAFPVVPFETVLPTTLPAATSVGRPMRIRACAGEYEPASFAIRALKPLRSVTLKASDLVLGKNRIAAKQINAHIVKVWKQAGPPTMADATLGAGHDVPELLLKDDRVALAEPRPELRLTGQVKTSIAANTTKQFWLTVRVPDRLPAGRYRGTVSVRADGVDLAKVPLEINVLPFRLSPPRKKVGIWFKAERRRSQREFVSTDVYRRLLTDVRAHGMQFVTIRGRGMGIAEEVLKIHQAAGMRGITIWSSWFPSSLRKFDAPRKALEAATRKHGYQKLYFQAADEPNSEAQIGRALAYFSKVKAAGGLTFCNIMPEYAVRLGDRLDVPCVGYANFFGSLERPEPVAKQSKQALAKLLKTHKEVWYYWQCRIEDPRINRMLFGFLLMKSPATGAMPYTYSTLEGSKPFDDWSNLREGQISRAGGGAVYHTRHGPLPTIQWEAAREGVDDARYITTLEHLIRQARKRPRLVAQADQAEKTLKSIYQRLPTHLYKTLQVIRPADLASMRSKLITEILRLHPALEGKR